MPCEDCDVLLEPDSEWYSSGPAARVCRSCQNKRYEAMIAGTPKGERRERRKALLAKKRRLESRIERDHGELASVLRELQADVTASNCLSKVKMKVSGCFRTQVYGEAYARISSYLQSMAALGYNPLVAIQIALAGHAADTVKEHNGPTLTAAEKRPE